MIKNILIITVIAVLSVVFFVGCPDVVSDAGNIARVDFVNDTFSPGVNINYGIRIGSATYIGFLGPGDDTYYYSPAFGYSTSPGSYYVELRDGYGNWIIYSSSTFSLVAGHAYDVEYHGNDTSNDYWYLYDWGAILSPENSPSLEKTSYLKSQRIKIAEIPVDGNNQNVISNN